MSPLPTDAVKTGPPRSRFTTVAITLLIALGVVLLLYFMLDEPDPDRPPIIVSGGSVIIQSSATWTNEGGGRYKEKVAKGRSVKNFSAKTGVCTVAGKKLTVMFGATSITLEPKRKGLFGKHDAEFEFPANIVVNSNTPTMLMVVTNDALVSVSNGTTTCPVAGQRIEIQQLH